MNLSNGKTAAKLLPPKPSKPSYGIGISNHLGGPKKDPLQSYLHVTDPLTNPHTKWHGKHVNIMHGPFAREDGQVQLVSATTLKVGLVLPQGSGISYQEIWFDINQVRLCPECAGDWQT